LVTHYVRLEVTEPSECQLADTKVNHLALTQGEKVTLCSGFLHRGKGWTQICPYRKDMWRS